MQHQFSIYLLIAQIFFNYIYVLSVKLYTYMYTVQFIFCEEHRSWWYVQWDFFRIELKRNLFHFIFYYKHWKLVIFFNFFNSEISLINICDTLKGETILTITAINSFPFSRWVGHGGEICVACVERAWLVRYVSRGIVCAIPVQARNSYQTLRRNFSHNQRI